MNYKVKGSIASISEKKVRDNGASIVDYVVSVTSDNGYVTPYNFSMYKKAEYAEHVDNFIKFNKVGDVVDVEFTIRGQEYNGKIYNSLNHWRCDKVEMSPSDAVTPVTNEADDLPF
tara:strand:+ start:280 stop:627 length:348 start_codon:yes stop_codon:yes gene_type:complete